MRTARRLIGMLSNLVQFFPLSLFATYAFWRGVPANERWVGAFELAALAAVVQLLILLPQRRPLNRLILGANLYLLIGGAAALAQQWWVLDVYGVLRESAIFLSMLGVGVVTTLATPTGFVAVADAPREQIRRSSLWLLGATLIAFAMALAFQGNRALAAVLLVVALAVLQRVLARSTDLGGLATGPPSPPTLVAPRHSQGAPRHASPSNAAKSRVGGFGGHFGAPM